MIYHQGHIWLEDLMLETIQHITAPMQAITHRLYLIFRGFPLYVRRPPSVISFERTTDDENVQSTALASCGVSIVSPSSQEDVVSIVSEATLDEQDEARRSRARERFKKAVRTVISMQSYPRTYGSQSLDWMLHPSPASHSHTPSIGGKVIRCYGLSTFSQNLECMEEISPHQALVRDLQFSPDGKYLTMASMCLQGRCLPAEDFSLLQDAQSNVLRIGSTFCSTHTGTRHLLHHETEQKHSPSSDDLLLYHLRISPLAMNTFIDILLHHPDFSINTSVLAHSRQHSARISTSIATFADPPSPNDHFHRNIFCLCGDATCTLLTIDQQIVEPSANCREWCRQLTGFCGPISRPALAQEESNSGAQNLWTGHAHQTLMGHTGPVTCLQFDEMHIASGNLDKSIWIWDVRTGSTLETLKYDHAVTALQFNTCKGQVKQIVGGTLSDRNDDGLKTNFVATQPPEYFAGKYRDNGLEGGHVIKLGPRNDKAARRALAEWRDHLQIGGGITSDNAKEWLDAMSCMIYIESDKEDMRDCLALCH
ncbi:hypothetical protein C8R48DRAFT_678673 [Suillus tomentosus]|nr:hypothetical protein C8R48DRAFT_678673 [Suillus tomentosus]